MPSTVLGAVVVTSVRHKACLIRLLCLTGAAGLGAGLSATPARADTDAGTTTVNVEVSSGITLTGLTASFTLTGAPGSLATTGLTPVTMLITTNNSAGYNVTVQPDAASLTGAISGNTDTIATSDLEVDGPTQGGAYEPLDAAVPLVVYTKTSQSGPNGDTADNNFRVTVPAIRADTYSGSLDYIVTTL